MKLYALIILSIFMIASCTSPKNFTKTKTSIDELKNNKELDCQKDNIKSAEDLYTEAIKLQKADKEDEAEIKIMVANEMIRNIKKTACPETPEEKDNDLSQPNENSNDDNVKINNDFNPEIKNIPDPANEKISLSVVSNYTPETIYFDFNSYKIKEDSQKTLLKHLDFLLANPQVNVTIGGHTDSRGSEEYNLTLGEKRALVIKKFFITQGISKERLKTITYGEELPADNSNTKEAHNKNRRAEFKFLLSK